MQKHDDTIPKNNTIQYTQGLSKIQIIKNKKKKRSYLRPQHLSRHRTFRSGLLLISNLFPKVLNAQLCNKSDQLFHGMSRK